MVKISEPNEKIVKVKPPKLLPSDPTTSQKKDKPIQLRLTKSIADQLRLYAEEHSMTITAVVENMVIQKFHDRKITRHFFNLDKPATILVPTTDTLLAMYTDKKINLLADIVETSTDGYKIRTFDKQAVLYNDFIDEFQIMDIHQVSNVFDVYDPKEEAYYSKKGLQEGEDKFLNHAGLIILATSLLNLETNVLDTLTLLIFVSSYAGILREAKIITKEEAIKIAKSVGNIQLADYILAIDNEIQDIQHIYDVRKNELDMTYTIKHLEDENKMLKEEIEAIKKKEPKQLEAQIETLKKEIKILKDGYNHVDEIMEDRVKDMFEAMMNSVKSKRTIDEVQEKQK